MKAIGFNLCQRGDIILNTVAARAFKQQYPEYHLTLGVGPQYSDMEMLFVHHEFIDAFHTYSSFEGWPDARDCKYLIDNNFDIVYNGFPRHGRDDWWRYVSQEEEVCIMNGLPLPDNLQCNLTRWFDVPDNKKYIALAPIGGWQDYPNKKSFSVARANELIVAIKSLGYGVIQLGGPDEPRLEGAEKSTGSYFEQTKEMLGCKALVSVDTGRAWLAAAYSFPTLGCYSNEYYGKENIIAIQPTNPNAKYLDDVLVNDLPIDQIIAALKEITS